MDWNDSAGPCMNCGKEDNRMHWEDFCSEKCEKEYEAKQKKKKKDR